MRQRCFQTSLPDDALHLAIKLMAGSDMSKMAASLIHDNDTINANVLRCAHEVNCDKVVSVLSSFAYPERVELPIDESVRRSVPPVVRILRVVKAYA